MAEQNKQSPDGEIGTTAHEWDGIQELNTPLPRWWLWTFYATILFAVGYCVAYPAIPLASRATAGVLHWSSHGQLAAEQAKAEASRASFRLAVANTPVERISHNPDLMRAAIEGGRAAFKVNCVQCHGTGASGRKGYPNLTDDDWLWGGDIKTIRQTLEHGIRQPGGDQTRMSQMPAFGRDGILRCRLVMAVSSTCRSSRMASQCTTRIARSAAMLRCARAASGGALPLEKGSGWRVSDLSQPAVRPERSRRTWGGADASESALRLRSVRTGLFETPTFRRRS